MTGNLGGLKVELTREDLLWLVQNSNGNGHSEPRYGDPVDEGNHAPMDELTAIEEHLNKRNPGAFVDQKDLIAEANAARAAAYRAFALHGAAAAAVLVDDPHEGVPCAAPAVDPGVGDPNVTPVPPVTPVVPTPIPGAF